MNGLLCCTVDEGYVGLGGQSNCSHLLRCRSGFLESKRLARQKFPEKLIALDVLPKTTSENLLKHVLRSEIAT
jgi:acyl-CoA synthetase (AMP-forming)/AMP-acid ligase II